MHSSPQDSLYALLPAFIRNRDLQQGQPLRALMEVLESQHRTLTRGAQDAYDGWFIETCASELIPYLGDLVALGDLESGDAHIWNFRQLVADILTLRQAKGTPGALTRIATSTGGWPNRLADLSRPSGSRAPVFAASPDAFRRQVTRDAAIRPDTSNETNNPLVMSQDLEVLRPGGGTFDLHDSTALAHLDGPFDQASRTPRLGDPSGRAERKSPAQLTPSEVELNVWRLESYPLLGVTATRLDRGFFALHPFGVQTPLFNNPLELNGDLGGAPSNRPAPIRTLPLKLSRADLVANIDHLRSLEIPDPDFFASPAALRLVGEDGREIPPESIQVQDLSSGQRLPPASYLQKLPDGRVVERQAEIAVDPRLGLAAWPLGSGSKPAPKVDFSFGFSADIGGGPYPRDPFAELDPCGDLWCGVIREVTKSDPDRCSMESCVPDPLAGLNANLYATLPEALEAWKEAAPRRAILLLPEPSYSLGPKPLELTLRGEQTLVLAATDGATPFLTGQLKLSGQRQEDRPRLRLDGLWIAGHLTAIGELDLEIRDCTLRSTDAGPCLSTLDPRPGNDPDAAGDGPHATVLSSILGPVEHLAGVAWLEAEDCILDGGTDAAVRDTPAGVTVRADEVPGHRDLLTHLTRVTVFGTFTAAQLTAVDTIFDAQVEIARLQEGTVRYSYVPPGSRTPPRWRCQPDLESQEIASNGRHHARRGTRPTFTSKLYGDPGFAQLGPRCPLQILVGAESGSEMGAFERLDFHRRETALQTAIYEWIPWGMSANYRFVT